MVDDTCPSFPFSGGERESLLPVNGRDIRELHYNTSGIKKGDQPIETRLVLKLHTEPTECNISLYEVVDGERQLRDWKIATQQSLEFTVHRAGEQRMPSTQNYYLILEVIEQSTEYSHTSMLLNSKAMLIVYTNNNESARSLTGPLPTVQKRQTQDNTVANNSPLQDLRELPCQMHEIFRTYEELGWPGSAFIVIQPQHGLTFDYCHGHCSSPFGTMVNYTNHSGIQAVYNQLDSNIPPPCCVPWTLVFKTLIYRRRGVPDHIARTCYQSIGSCRCQ